MLRMRLGTGGWHEVYKVDEDGTGYKVEVLRG